MPAPIDNSTPNQSYDPQMSFDDPSVSQSSASSGTGGAGGTNAAPRTDGAEGAGHAPKAAPPPEETSCFREEIDAAIACGKLIKGFDFFTAAACAVKLYDLADCKLSK